MVDGLPVFIYAGVCPGHLLYALVDIQAVGVGQTEPYMLAAMTTHSYTLAMCLWTQMPYMYYTQGEWYHAHTHPGAGMC